MNGVGHSDDDIEQIAEKVAERVANRLFITLGINVQNPDELKKMQLDFAHLRGWRENVEAVKQKSLGAAAAFIVTAILGYVIYLFGWRH